MKGGTGFWFSKKSKLVVNTKGDRRNYFTFKITFRTTHLC